MPRSCVSALLSAVALAALLSCGLLSFRVALFAQQGEPIGPPKDLKPQRPNNPSEIIWPATLPITGPPTMPPPTPFAGGPPYEKVLMVRGVENPGIKDPQNMEGRLLLNNDGLALRVELPPSDPPPAGVSGRQRAHVLNNCLDVPLTVYVGADEKKLRQLAGQSVRLTGLAAVRDGKIWFLTVKWEVVK